jgi:hypothetical protein
MKLLLVVFVLLPVYARAQSDTSHKFTPNRRSTLALTKRTAPITLDGDLSDQGWKNASVADNFVETRPGDQTEPTSQTKAMITYDEDYLYVGMIAYDDPKAIHASLVNRDGIFDQDFMGVIIDTYGDAVRAYEMYSNPLGVQGDVLWTDNGDDVSYDIVYESEARITDAGYQIELRIPFRSLRFPDREKHEWRATFWRVRPRESRLTYSWVMMDRDDPCTFCSFGTFTGLEGIRSGNALELLPALVGHQSSTLNENGDALAHEKPTGDIALGIRYPLGPSASLEATINPDFSQIESDAAQVDVNSTFALFYPERRPFFREGMDLFETWIPVIYTRSINDPIGALKVINRMGSSNIAFLSAYDMHTPVLIPNAERSHVFQREESLTNILRATHAFNGTDVFGLVVTDQREKDRGSSSVYGVDGRFVVYEKLRFEGQVLGSAVREPDSTALLSTALFDRGRHTVNYNGESFGGHAAYLSLERFTRTLDFDIDFWAKSPTFRSANGFVTRNNSLQGNIWAGYKFPMTEHPIFTEIRPNIAISRIWNYDGTRIDEWVAPAVNIDLKAQTSVGVNYLASRELFRNVEFPGIWRLSSWFDSQFSEPVTIGASYTFGRSIARNTDVPLLGHSYDFGVWGKWQPSEQFSVTPEYTFSRLDSSQGQTIYSGSIVRSRFSYQFTRELSARLVAEYDGFDDVVRFEPLITYRINPFSVFYAGSSHRFDNPETDIGTTGHQLRPTDRQFFAKFQYLFQVG